MVAVLDIFCGGGGSSYGAQAAGAEIACGIDLCSIATETFERNFPDAVVRTEKLENVRLRKLRDDIGDIDLLLASPECTNHTCAKGSAPRSEKSRETAMLALRFARFFKPRWIVLENVVHMRPWSRYEELKERLANLDYQIRECVLDAADFGVGQKRRRLFILCDREQEPPEIEPPKNARAPTVEKLLDKPEVWKRTMLKRKGRAKGTLQRAKRAIKELGNEKAFLIVYYGSDGSGGWQRINRPLRTITTVDRFALVVPGAKGHEMRMLQVPELKRFMGFEDGYEMPAGTRRDKIRLLGNSVCPPVMKTIVDQMTRDTSQG